MNKRYDEQHRMPNKLIEEKAYEVIAEYCRMFPRRASKTPINIESLVDSLWSFEVEITDLQGLYGQGTHGALFIYGGERRIAIDKSIDPSANPKMRGRYNYSLAHEAGHWILHSSGLLHAEDFPELFNEKGKPAILCRSSQRDERERQADRFAGFLLMPHDYVCKKWYDLYGENARPKNVFDELNSLRDKYHLSPDDRKVFCQVSRDFAPMFGVSPEAMQIRLSEMGLIHLEKEEQEYLL